MTIHTIDEALAYLSRDPKSVEAECARVVNAEVEQLERIIDDGGDHRLCAKANEAATAEAVLMRKQRNLLAVETRVPTTLEAAGLREEIRSELIREALKSQDELQRLRSMTQCSMGVGNGSGNLHVHGDYESIKAAQRFVFAVERARALVDGWRRGEAGRIAGAATRLCADQLEAALSGKDGK
jgi:hypothetical protein